MRTEKQKMLAGELYRPGDPEIQADQAAAKSWMVRYNAALGASAAERRALLRELLPEVGDGAVIRPPFHCDFGYNIRLGPDVFLNFNCVILDVVAVTIGAGTQIGPAVQFRRRQTSSRLATFAEAFSSIGWAATAALALSWPSAATMTGFMTAGVLAATWKISPRRK